MKRYAPPKQYSVTFEYHWERDPVGDSVTMLLSYTVYALIPQTYNAPAEGGECELTSVALPKWTTSTSDGPEVIAAFEKAYESDKALKDSVEEACRYNASVACEQTDD